MKAHILIMTKFPRSGEVNTRMIPEIGAESAALVHRRMAEHTISTANGFPSAKTIIHVANCTTEEAAHWLTPHEWIPQQGQDLGERMENALNHSIMQGADKVLIIGTDCPTLSSKIFEQALLALDQHDVVYAPAHDGGYVLLGMKSLHQAAFHNISWGTGNVLEQSLQQLRANQLTYRLLEPMQDVDYADDIPRVFLTRA